MLLKCGEVRCVALLLLLLVVVDRGVGVLVVYLLCSIFFFWEGGGQGVMFEFGAESMVLAAFLKN